MPTNQIGVEERPGAESHRWLWTYLVITFLLSALFDYPIFGRTPLSEQGGWFIWAVMWCPGFVALGFVVLGKATLRDLGLTNFGGIRLAWGLLIPLAITGPVYLIAAMAGYCRIAPSALSGNMMSILVLLPPALGRALGEEIGWRGFLFPRLRLRYSFAAACLISGIVWSVWHYAVIVQGGYLDAARVPLWAALVLFTIRMVGETFVYSWLRERSGSVWPVVCLHGFFNWFTQRLMGAVVQPTPTTSLMVGEMSLGCALMGVLLAALFWRGPRFSERRKMPSHGNPLPQS